MIQNSCTKETYKKAENCNPNPIFRSFQSLLFFAVPPCYIDARVRIHQSQLIAAVLFRPIDKRESHFDSEVCEIPRKKTEKAPFLEGNRHVIFVFRGTT